MAEGINVDHPRPRLYDTASKSCHRTTEARQNVAAAIAAFVNGRGIAAVSRYFAEPGLLTQLG